jgi:hypothetical protein
MWAPRSKAAKLYQDFKTAFVANAPPNVFRVSSPAIDVWLELPRQAQALADLALEDAELTERGDRRGGAVKVRSADPFRDVVELASDRRQALLEAFDRGELAMTEPAWGEIMAYGTIVRAGLEAAGMFPRQVLPVPPGQIVVVAKDEASARAPARRRRAERPHPAAFATLAIWRRS